MNYRSLKLLPVLTVCVMGVSGITTSHAAGSKAKLGSALSKPEKLNYRDKLKYRDKLRVTDRLRATDKLSPGLADQIPRVDTLKPEHIRKIRIEQRQRSLKRFRRGS